jgi:putative intracellular protease/amidase
MPTQPSHLSRHVVLIAANPTTSTTTGWPVGFWASELIHPYDYFTQKGYRVTLASPAGGVIAVDAWSDPRDASGYSKDDHVSLGYLNDPAFTARLEKTVALSALRAEEYDAVVVVGGQAPMFTFPQQPALHAFLQQVVAANKIFAALCHGVCALLYMKNPDGSPFIKGRRITGFTNQEEDYADHAVGKKVMPFRIEDAARALGADFHTLPAFQPHAMRDGQLITGQQQMSGHAVAELVVAALS